MSAENLHEFGKGMLGCAQLVKEEVDILGDSVVAEFEVVIATPPASPQDDWSLSEQLVEGLEGTCITGQRGECPKGHNCGKVRIIASVPPLYIEVNPLEVKDDQKL